MGIAEIEPPPPGSPGVFDLPVWLLIPLALMWVFFAMREPKNGGPNYGWYTLPAIVTVVAGIAVAGLSRGA